MNKRNLIPCFLLAAGRGERMRPLTDELPKPLLTIKNKSLLAWHLEALSTAGIKEVVINHAWLGHKIEEALSNGSQFDLNITYSPETSALETAGGIRKALPLLNPSDYFLVINGDVFSPNLPIHELLEQVTRLRSMSNKPLAHLLMVPNPVQHPEGDFYLKDSKVTNQLLDGAEKLTFSGIGLYHRELFKDLELGSPAKLAPLLREAMTKNRVSGEKYTGPWHDVGTPQRLQELNAAND
ncbi:MAG: mannose-1-phosphate guanylyltransferase [Polynucleobacter sp. 24-46-87]|jgi:MurNAc alpha-1-phosphate uridylyltransferase|uniref:N-acetylmuramate alpha-1-phosphate uridylyltransferase MurU n=1 Tax=unclassified Polynucleobacter TaxID=2640945 RepID=UPI000BC4466C|nr:MULTISPECIES: nucleotidyltransferase family protein [unclassified Polynucleobacter]OYY20888.1 MAG: mannose-1-phosphate guanylyltransferase [Polynucleobacter sp. 35-46-11]OZA15884.1 MAG: mannose-1-phosphate guanylyltransferase [Polynucleobacter sp. 24-46-87]OZA78109.1 MAG: mannose-1-phosphate guanylyltransferase [Polynucleobacter sp. 39-46-10]